MKNFCIFLFVCMLTFVSATAVCASQEEADITLKDYSGILSDSAKEYIKHKNEILFASTEAKIIFVTTDSTDGLSAQKYCENLFDEWSMKSYGRNNSILCVIAPKSEDYGFIRGGNISLALTDEMLDKFIVQDFEPDFSKQQYDRAVLKMFNSLAGWYETEYNNLSLSLDENISEYIGGTKTKDIEKKPNRIWMWIGLAVCLTVLLMIVKIKRNIDLKIRQHERRKFKKKFKIDIDKIVNS